MTKSEKIIKKRYAAETRFRIYGKIAVGIGILTVCFLLYTVFSAGYSAFKSTSVAVDLDLDPKLMRLETSVTSDNIAKADMLNLLRRNLIKIYPEIRKRRERKDLTRQPLEGSADLVPRTSEILNFLDLPCFSVFSIYGAGYISG